MKRATGLFSGIQRKLQLTAMVLIGLIALSLAVLSGAAALGQLRWLELAASVGDAPIANAGMWVQLGATALFGLLALYLPATTRILQLENSHRDFSLTMEDVIRAYQLSHAADRRTLFKTGGEFDSVRDRIAHLRAHPDLGALEPEVLELAAQMSHAARDLARVYSDEKVARARQFLQQRQEEVEAFQDTLTLARRTSDELRHWLGQVQADEALAARQITALESDLMALLPELGLEVAEDVRETTPRVVPLPRKPRGAASPRPPAHSKPER